MRIAVIGAGVLGSLYAGRLKLAGEDVVLIARGPRLEELRDAALTLVDEASGKRTHVTVPEADHIGQSEHVDFAFVMVRAEQVDQLLPELAALDCVQTFVFLHNRAAGASAFFDAVGRERVLIGFPGAGGERDRNTINYELILQQPTTLGEPDGAISPRLRLLASMLERAGFATAMTKRIDDWLKVHAVFVTAIAGAIYDSGSASLVARDRRAIRRLVDGVRQGFAALSAQGIRIVPRKLAVLFALPLIAQSYWRRFLAKPQAELVFARHAFAAPAEMWTLVGQLRDALPGTFDRCRDLQELWAAVEQRAKAR